MHCGIWRWVVVGIVDGEWQVAFEGEGSGGGGGGGEEAVVAAWKRVSILGRMIRGQRYNAYNILVMFCRGTLGST